MIKGAINFSNDDEYYTPKSLVSRFGVFDYDPATTAEKAAEFGVKEFDTIKTNGLLKDWTPFKRIWINPPFTQKHLFLIKAVNTYLYAKNDIYFLCPIGFLTTKRFYDQIKKVGGIKLFLPNGRMRFESGLGKPSRSPAFGSVVLKIQDSNEIQLFDLSYNGSIDSSKEGL